MSPLISSPLILLSQILLTQEAMSALQVWLVCKGLQAQLDPNRLQIVNFALGELGSAAIKSKSDVAKMKAADIKLLAEYLQQHLDHDPQDGEPLNFDKDCVMVDGAYPYSKSGNPTAADVKQGLRAFLAS